MTIQVTGDNAAAQTLRGYLKTIGYEVLDAASKTIGDLVIQIEQGTQPNVALQGVRGQLANEALHAIAGLAATPIEWTTAIAGSEKVIRVIAGANQTDAVIQGLLQAVFVASGYGAPAAIGTGLFGLVSRLWKKSK